MRCLFSKKEARFCPKFGLESIYQRADNKFSFQMPFVFSNGISSAMPGIRSQMVYNQAGFAVNSQGSSRLSSGENQNEEGATNPFGSQTASCRSQLRDPSIEHNLDDSKVEWQNEQSCQAQADVELDCIAYVTDAVCDESGQYRASGYTASRRPRRRGSKTARKPLNANSAAENIETNEYEVEADEICKSNASTHVNSDLSMAGVAQSKSDCNNPSDAEKLVPRLMSLIEETAHVLDNHIRHEMPSTEKSPIEQCHIQDNKTQSIEQSSAVEANLDHMVYERDAMLTDNSRSLQTTPVKMHTGTHSRRKSSRGSRNAQKLMSFQDFSVNCSDNHLTQHENKQIAD